MMYMTKKRTQKLFRPSKKVEAKKVILLNSLDEIKKTSQTPDDVIHNLIKWSFNYHSVFANSKSIVSRHLNSITLKNGNNVPHINKSYSLYANSKALLTATSAEDDFGDVLTSVKNIIKAMETGKWYFKQNPRYSFGHYAKPIDMDCAVGIINDVKEAVDQLLYLNDEGRIQRIRKFNAKYGKQLAK